MAKKPLTKTQRNMLKKATAESSTKFSIGGRPHPIKPVSLPSLPKPRS